MVATLNNVTENVRKVQELERAVREHCLCFKLTPSATHYFVTLPSGYAVDAVRAYFNRGCTKAIALKRIADKLEEIWLKS